MTVPMPVLAVVTIIAARIEKTPRNPLQKLHRTIGFFDNRCKVEYRRVPRFVGAFPCFSRSIIGWRDHPERFWAPGGRGLSPVGSPQSFFPSETIDMKKFVVICSLALLVSMVGCGCGSMSNCFTRNGSRVPVASNFGTPVNAPVASPIMDSQMVYSSGCNPCSAVTNACNPCSTQPACNPCDPCGTSSSGYPMGGTMPGPAGN